MRRRRRHGGLAGLVNLAVALGVKFDYVRGTRPRRHCGGVSGREEIEGLTTLTFGQRIAGRDCLQGSNPSERWKWDFMFQDLPPIKGSVDPSSLPMPPGAIQLREVK